MTNLQAHIIEWLNEIGADGLMVPAVTTHIYQVDSELERAIESWGLDSLVPAFRHTDGSYHVEKEVFAPCVKCGEQFDCGPLTESTCPQYQSWLSHKEEAK